ncbi:LLM class F420-dependent oxidoreductase [Pseudonocardia xishanensis]|uniref:LLM class F420-dependent oxidoreductase n=1 Tax=Pseudonocardia xishanensis TaxID=630995 RepID=A0ABP8RYC6_9PSEU
MDSVSVERVRDVGAELEALGFGAVWIPESSGRDVFVQLYTLLSATRRLVGATGIANIWARDAVAMSAAATSLTELFPRRVVLGLGVSHAPLVAGVRGHAYARPLGAMESYLRAMHSAPYQGPLVDPAPARLLGALGPRMQRLAGEAADGIHPYLVTGEAVAAAREALGPRPLICPALLVCLQSDRAQARAAVALYMGLDNYVRNFRRMGFTDDDFVDGGSDRLVDAIVAWGSVDQVAGRVRELREAGADHVCLNVVSERRQVPMDEWRRLAAAVTEQGRATDDC